MWFIIHLIRVACTVYGVVGINYSQTNYSNILLEVGKFHSLKNLVWEDCDTWF